MRIISQKGLGYEDVNYERSKLSVCGYSIFADICEGENGIVLANYCSYETIEYAMEMLLDAYADGCAFFRFPQEGEIE